MENREREKEEKKAKELKEQEAADKAAELAAEDNYALTESGGAWNTNMSVQEAYAIKKWYPTISAQDAAHT
eukprot:15413533-Heterocapsa_arctica.AAC.1